MVLGWIEDGAIAQRTARIPGRARRKPRAALWLAARIAIRRGATGGFPAPVGGQARAVGAELQPHARCSAGAAGCDCEDAHPLARTAGPFRPPRLPPPPTTY